MSVFFFKSHALGNDYIVLDSEMLLFELSQKNIKLICDRHFGIGSDGILLKVPSSQADFGLKIFNPDGSEAQKSGNGLRIFCDYLYRNVKNCPTQFTVETLGGVVSVQLRMTSQEVESITIQMGEAQILWSCEQDWPEIGKVEATAVSLGNPHCVLFGQPLAESYMRKIGPLIESHSLFKDRTNVQCVKVIDRNRIDLQIWERGAGYTLASGSSSCAAAAACFYRGLVDEDIVVSMPGGEIKIEINWPHVKMTGEVSPLYQGQLSPLFLAKLREQSQ